MASNSDGRAWIRPRRAARDAKLLDGVPKDAKEAGILANLTAATRHLFPHVFETKEDIAQFFGITRHQMA